MQCCRPGGNEQQNYKNCSWWFLHMYVTSHTHTRTYKLHVKSTISVQTCWLILLDNFTSYKLLLILLFFVISLYSLSQTVSKPDIWPLYSAQYPAHFKQMWSTVLAAVTAWLRGLWEDCFLKGKSAYSTWANCVIVNNNDQLTQDTLKAAFFHTLSGLWIMFIIKLP